MSAWLFGAVAAASWPLWSSGTPGDAIVVGGVALVALPIAFFGAVAIHELLHVAVARALGMRVTRVVLGEGRRLLGLGSNPDLVLGEVVLGNGVTYFDDLRLSGIRRRLSAVMLAAPIGSLAIAVAAFALSHDWAVAPRTAALIVATANLAMAVITLLPVPTFEGRVWSDLAHARRIARLPDDDLPEEIAAMVQQRLRILLERGDSERATREARELAATVPTSPLAHSLLAYFLHATGDRAGAADVARRGIGITAEESHRAYLSQFLDVIPSAERQPSATDP